MVNNPYYPLLTLTKVQDAETYTIKDINGKIIGEIGFGLILAYIEEYGNDMGKPSGDRDTK